LEEKKRNPRWEWKGVDRKKKKKREFEKLAGKWRKSELGEEG